MCLKEMKKILTVQMEVSFPSVNSRIETLTFVGGIEEKVSEPKTSVLIQRVARRKADINTVIWSVGLCVVLSEWHKADTL
jgi:hypothetical protein